MMQPAAVHTSNYTRDTHGINIEEVTVVSAQMRFHRRRAVREVSVLILELGCTSLQEKKKTQATERSCNDVQNFLRPRSQYTFQ